MTDKQTRNRQNAPSRARYEAKAYRKVTIRMPKDQDPTAPERSSMFEQVEHAAEQDGQSVNAWILDAIREKL